jgi:hypothetical protein
LASASAPAPVPPPPPPHLATTSANPTASTLRPDTPYAFAAPDTNVRYRSPSRPRYRSPLPATPVVHNQRRHRAPSQPASKRTFYQHVTSYRLRSIAIHPYARLDHRAPSQQRRSQQPDHTLPLTNLTA